MIMELLSYDLSIELFNKNWLEDNNKSFLDFGYGWYKQDEETIFDKNVNHIGIYTEGELLCIAPSVEELLKLFEPNLSVSLSYSPEIEGFFASCYIDSVSNYKAVDALGRLYKSLHS